MYGTIASEQAFEEEKTRNAGSEMGILLNGENARRRVISHSVAKDFSTQVFYPHMSSNAKCFVPVPCDSIFMGKVKIRAIPKFSANCMDAQLIHETAIGRNAGVQLLKLQTLA